MRTLIVRAGLLLLVTAAVGCVRTATTPFGSAARYPAVPADSVVVYRDASAVPGSFEQLAVVSAKGDFTLHGVDDVVRALRKEAGELGANGLLLAGVRSPSSTEKVVSVLFGSKRGRRHGQAVAIRVHPDSARPHGVGGAP